MGALASARTVLLQPALAPLGLCSEARGGADAVIWDLEDGVPTEQKGDARAHVRDALARADGRSTRCLVRLNAVDSEFHDDDLKMLDGFDLAAIVVPKATAAAIRVLEGRTQLRLVALIETARGIADVREIASMSKVSGLIFGAFDLSADIGLRPLPDQSELLAYRAEVVLASVLAGLGASLDSPSRHGSDTDVRSDAARSRSLGFTGKLCAGVWQVPHVAAAFRPSDAEIEAAQRILAGPGSLQDGVEAAARPALLRQALRTLDLPDDTR